MTNTATIYKVSVYNSSFLDAAPEFYSLRPLNYTDWSGNYEDDDGKQYTLPEGYRITTLSAKDYDGTNVSWPAIVDPKGHEVQVEIGPKGLPMLLDTGQVLQPAHNQEVANAA